MLLLAAPFAILGVFGPPIAPKSGTTLQPCVLCPRLVLPIIGITAALGLLPAPHPFLLTLWFATVLLIRNLRTSLQRLPAPRTPVTQHGPSPDNPLRHRMRQPSPLGQRPRTVASKKEESQN